MKAIILAVLPLVAFAAHAPAPHYGYAPKYHCRDTNTSVYAEVCVPAFASKTTPVTLAVKNVVDNDYCYDQIRTVCEETSRTEPREICTYNYVKKAETRQARTTQVYTLLP